MDTVPARVFQSDSYDFGKRVVNLQDVNGDGKIDFAIGSGAGIYIYYGGTLDTTPSQVIHETWREMTAAGDVNGDGYSDL